MVRGQTNSVCCIGLGMLTVYQPTHKHEEHESHKITEASLFIALDSSGGVFTACSN